MKKSGNSSYIIKVLVFVGALVILAMSTSYAYFTLKINGESTKTNLVAGKLDIDTDLTTKKATIDNAKLSLIKESEKNEKADKVEFYIQNSSTDGIDALYYVYLDDVTLTDNLKDKKFKWELVKKTGSLEESVINSGDFSTITGTTTQVSVENNGKPEQKSATHADKFLLNKTNSESDEAQGVTLTNGTKDTLIFRIWLEDDPSNNQESLLNGSFKAKLYFEAIPTK